MKTNNSSDEANELNIPVIFAKLNVDKPECSLVKDDVVILLQKHKFKNQQAYYIESKGGKCTFVYEKDLELLKTEFVHLFHQIPMNNGEFFSTKAQKRTHVVLFKLISGNLSK
jgi:hypothetical protein